MKRKICVITGTRAEFGLLRLLMQGVHDSLDCELQIVATGMHLSTEHGLTFKEIEQAGFKIDYKVDMQLSSDSATSITKSIGIGTIGFAEAYASLQPDLIVVLGDRFELIPAVTAALIACIPVAHLHGGETTEGAFDEAIRHSITKMSHLHFVAAPEYARRVVQLGEHPERVFLVGGLGVDAIKQIKLLTREQLEESLDFKFGKKSLLVTFHPVTLSSKSSTLEMAALLEALDQLRDTHLIFTMPNADTGGQELAAMIKEFVLERPHTRVFESLGHVRYLSCMQFVDGVVGNSSSGLAEAPSMGIGTVNIGDRQKGRLSTDSVIHCASDVESIHNALEQLYDPAFKILLSNAVNPYGSGGASNKIAEIIKNYPLDGLLKKSFFDLPAAVTHPYIIEHPDQL
jgi:GDP/UDP-N,N'-diacetylbacillosamine 2-epimerase (hydrolysing)